MFTSSPVWFLSLLSSHYFSPPSFFSLHTCLKARCALRDKWEHRKPFICLFSTFFSTLCLLIFPSHTAAPAPSMHKCIRSFSTSGLRHATHSWQGYISEVRGLLPLMPSLSFSNSEGTVRLQKHMKLLGHVFLFLVCHLHSTIQEVVCLRIRTYSTFSFQTKGAHFERCNL